MRGRTEDIALRRNNFDNDLTGADGVGDGEGNVNGDSSTHWGFLGGSDDAGDVTTSVVIVAAQTHLFAQEDGFGISPAQKR